jgi:SLOG cluster2
VIRWTGNNHQRIIHSALREHLRFLFTKLRTDALKGTGRIPAGARVLMRAPEILDCQTLAHEDGEEPQSTLVVYPDPPLGAEEEKIISSFGRGMSFTTFIMPAERVMLSNRMIGLSISESSDLAGRGLSETHLRDALIEFTRQFLARDASVAYGGDLRAGGFTQVLFDLVRAHNSSGTPATYRPIRDYLAWPLHLNLDTDAEAELIRVAQILREPLPADLAGNPSLDPRVFLPPDSAFNRYVWARCLTAMRRHLNSDIDVRVLLGGRVDSYKGRYPGLLEEAYLALTEKKPLFLLGAFGGCTEAIIELVEGGQPESLTVDFQYADASYREFATEYNNRVGATPALGLEPIDYEQVANAFRTAGINGLGNGLSVEENRLLFAAEDLDEIIYLVLKGISSLSRGDERSNQ